MKDAQKKTEKGVDYLREQIDYLARLQEHELVIQESEILHHNNSEQETSALQKIIQELREKIDPDLLARYDKLRRRHSDSPALVNEIKGVCTGCWLNVPIGDLRSMRNGNQPWVCPNCAKILRLQPE